MQHSSACFRWTMKHGKLCKMSNWRFFLEKHNAKNTLDLNFCMRHTSSSDYIEIALVELISCAKCIFTYTSFGFNIIWQIYTHKNQLMLHNFTKSESQWALPKKCVLSFFHLFRKCYDIRPDFDLYLLSTFFLVRVTHQASSNDDVLLQPYSLSKKIWWKLQK